MPNVLTTPKATLKDVARRAGVALSTASAALNQKGGKYAVSDETMAAVLRAVEELDFEVNPHARRLVIGTDSSTVGLFVLDLSVGISMIKTRDIQYALIREGYNVPIHSAGGSDVGDAASRARVLATLRLQRPCAIVSSSVEPEVLPEMQKYMDEGGILVTYDRECPLDCDKVVFDRYGNTYDATVHLLKLGHRRIGFYHDGGLISPPPPRYNAFIQAMKDYGAPVRQDWMVHSGNYRTGTLHEGGGDHLTEVFLGWRDRPTAMCILNDSSAAAFISNIQREGVRVPEDLSVIGHDDLPIARVVAPRLTTASHPSGKIVESVSRLILSRLDGSYIGAPRRIDVSGAVIEREREILR